MATNQASDGASTSASTGACSDPVGPAVVHNSRAEVEAAYVGRWILCGEKLRAHPAHIGIEFKTDHRWILLNRNSAGVLVATVGAENEGGYEVLDATSYNGPHMFQTNLTFDYNNGWLGGFNVFSSSPTGLRIVTDGGMPRYVATDE